jgi:predicted dithiol-disulfide oxidoreductase (DUF899 family)
MPGSKCLLRQTSTDSIEQRLDSPRKEPSDAHNRHHRDDWIAERKTLLAHEKELTRLHDRVARERRALPWVRIDKNYVFDTPEGRRTLADLFDGRRQLLVQHFMFAPGVGARLSELFLHG